MWILWSSLLWKRHHYSGYSGPPTPYLSVLSPKAVKCGKNVDQNNGEYGHILRSAYHKKKHPSSKAQETFSSDCLGIDLVPTAEMKQKPLILKRFFKKSICNLLKMNVTLMLPCLKDPMREGVLWGMSLRWSILASPKHWQG